MVRWLNHHLNIGLPKDLYYRIKKHPEIRWAAIAREALILYLEDLEKFKEERPNKLLEMRKTKDEIEGAKNATEQKRLQKM